MVKKELINIYKWRKIYKITDAKGQVIYNCEMYKGSEGATKSSTDLKTLYKAIDDEILYLKILDCMEKARMSRYY